MVVRDGQDVRFVSFRVVSNLVWWSFFVGHIYCDRCVRVGGTGSELRWR